MVKKTVLSKIKRFTKALAKDYKISAVYLFGSHARNEAGKYSDIDICIVSPDFKNKDLDLISKLRTQACWIDPRLDPYFTTADQLKNNLLSPLLHEIRKDKVRVAWR